MVSIEKEEIERPAFVKVTRETGRKREPQRRLLVTRLNLKSLFFKEKRKEGEKAAVEKAVIEKARTPERAVI